MRSSSLAAGAAVFAVAVLGSVPAMASSPVADASADARRCAPPRSSPVRSAAATRRAGNLYRYLVLTNHSATTCHLTGYPGVSMLNASGQQIGRPATRQAHDVLRDRAQAGRDGERHHPHGQPPGHVPAGVVEAEGLPAGEHRLAGRRRARSPTATTSFAITPLAAGRAATRRARPRPRRPARPVDRRAAGADRALGRPRHRPGGDRFARWDNTALAATGAAALVLGGAGVAVVRRRRVRAGR